MSGFTAVIHNLDGTSYQETFDEWIAAEGLARHLTRLPSSQVDFVAIRSSKGTKFATYYSPQNNS